MCCPIGQSGLVVFMHIKEMLIWIDSIVNVCQSNVLGRSGKNKSGFPLTGLYDATLFEEACQFTDMTGIGSDALGQGLGTRRACGFGYVHQGVECLSEFCVHSRIFPASSTCIYYRYKYRDVKPICQAEDMLIYYSAPPLCLFELGQHRLGLALTA
ncbi:hypothetical protein BITS_0170 [Bifidobacterium tsurumiense]|uniref:Uncharacterized protein n=1 Tax=Bifidobacterium tsurumiense TaxID=356829 RepID=A0A087ECJ3_9BIFI|nr:hypothetical protein BITS_0170 [Bifidobacterium tsurumiense]